MFKAPRKRKLFFKVAPWTRTLCRKPSVLCDWDIVRRFACQWMIVDMGGVSYFYYTEMARGNSTLKRGTSFQHFRKSLLPCWFTSGLMTGIIICEG